MDDRAAYEWWRRRDERGPRLEDTSWDREVSTVNQFYLRAIEQDLVRANPTRQRAGAVWSSWQVGTGAGMVRQVPAEMSRTGSGPLVPRTPAHPPARDNLATAA
jgi:hypothetical protein